MDMKPSRFTEEQIYLQAYVDGVGFSASGPPLRRALVENKGLAFASKTRREAQHHLTSDFCNKIGQNRQSSN